MSVSDFIYTDDILEKMSPRQLEHYRESLSMKGKKELERSLAEIRGRKRQAYLQSEKYRERQEYIKPKKRSISNIFGFKFWYLLYTKTNIFIYLYNYFEFIKQ